MLEGFEPPSWLAISYLWAAVLVDYKASGLVVKLPRPRVAALIADGTGKPFAPAGRTFSEWVCVQLMSARLVQ